MDHKKPIAIKKEVKNEICSGTGSMVQTYSVKIKEEPPECVTQEMLTDVYGTFQDTEQMYSSEDNVKFESPDDFSQDDMLQLGKEDEFAADGVDLYDDVIAAPSSGGGENSQPSRTPGSISISNADGHRPNSNLRYHQKGNNNQPNQAGKRQLYVGNLTWWTTDQDITDAILGIGVTDFVAVKFFENRANGQSKGFCVVTLGSEEGMRMCMERLPNKELHGQCPIVTFPTKAALNQFEAQSKTRPVPPPNPGAKNPHPRMMMGPPKGMRPRMPPPGMLPPGPGQRMPGPPIGHGGPQAHGHWHGNWNGPRPNGPPRPGLPPQGPHPQGPQHRPPPGMPFQGPPGQGPPRGPPPGTMQPDPRGPPPRPDWNRPPGPGIHHHPGPGFPPHSQHLPMQGPPGQGPPPRGPQPGQMGGPGGPPPGHGGPPVHGGPPQGPLAPHVNPTFFQQGAGPPHQGPPHQGPPPPRGPPHGYGPSPTPQPQYGAPPPEHRPEGPPPISEVEFEEIMGRNRTVSSSAIARAVSDAAAGEYAGAIETLVTAISLIKQSKVANDDRCKILVGSLQDTLHGVETKSYGSARRERSRSRDRERSRRHHRERSRSCEREYMERSRDQEREREHDRYYADAYPRDRSRSRERERERDYHERGHEDSSTRQAVRPRAKSPEPPEAVPVISSKARWYDDRYREREREREREGTRREPEREREREREGTKRERERDREGTRREPERERERDREGTRREPERERDRERERREERDSSHRSTRH